MNDIGLLWKRAVRVGSKRGATHFLLPLLSMPSLRERSLTGFGFPAQPRCQQRFLYSWRPSQLVHGYMTSNNKTVYRQMPSADNFAKTVTSNRKVFTVTCKMLATVAGNQSVLLKVAWSCWWNLSTFSKVAFILSSIKMVNLNHLLCCVTNRLMTDTLGNSEFCFPQISIFSSTSSWETKFLAPLRASH